MGKSPDKEVESAVVGLACDEDPRVGFYFQGTIRRSHETGGKERKEKKICVMIYSAGFVVTWVPSQLVGMGTLFDKQHNHRRCNGANERCISVFFTPFVHSQCPPPILSFSLIRVPFE
jgi:hypothetical protein